MPQLETTQSATTASDVAHERNSEVQTDLVEVDLAAAHPSTEDITDGERRQILSRRTGDIVKAVRGKDADHWWEECHENLDGRTPREVLMVCPITEAAVLLMNAAMGTARNAEGFQLV